MAGSFAIRLYCNDRTRFGNAVAMSPIGQRGTSSSVYLVHVRVSTSFYQRIGGEPAVSAAVTALYRVILADDRLTGYFAGVDLDRQVLAVSAEDVIETG
jgi:hypothetical protein